MSLRCVPPNTASNSPLNTSRNTTLSSSLANDSLGYSAPAVDILTNYQCPTDCVPPDPPRTKHGTTPIPPTETSLEEQLAAYKEERDKYVYIVQQLKHVIKAQHQKIQQLTQQQRPQQQETQQLVQHQQSQEGPQGQQEQEEIKEDESSCDSGIGDKLIDMKSTNRVIQIHSDLPLSPTTALRPRGVPSHRNLEAGLSPTDRRIAAVTARETYVTEMMGELREQKIEDLYIDRQQLRADNAELKLRCQKTEHQLLQIKGRLRWYKDEVDKAKSYPSNNDSSPLPSQPQTENNNHSNDSHKGCSTVVQQGPSGSASIRLLKHVLQAAPVISHSLSCRSTFEHLITAAGNLINYSRTKLTNSSNTSSASVTSNIADVTVYIADNNTRSLITPSRTPSKGNNKPVTPHHSPFPTCSTRNTEIDIARRDTSTKRKSSVVPPVYKLSGGTVQTFTNTRRRRSNSALQVTQPGPRFNDIHTLPVVTSTTVALPIYITSSMTDKHQSLFKPSEQRMSSVTGTAGRHSKGVGKKEICDDQVVCDEDRHGTREVAAVLQVVFKDNALSNAHNGSTQSSPRKINTENHRNSGCMINMESCVDEKIVVGLQGLCDSSGAAITHLHRQAVVEHFRLRCISCFELTTIATSCNTLLDLETFLRGKLTSFFGVDKVRVLFYDHKAHTLLLSAPQALAVDSTQYHPEHNPSTTSSTFSYSYPRGTGVKTFPASDGIVGQAVSKRDLVLVPNLTQSFYLDSEIDGAPRVGKSRTHPNGNMLAGPMVLDWGWTPDNLTANNSAHIFKGAGNSESGSGKGEVCVMGVVQLINKREATSWGNSNGHTSMSRDRGEAVHVNRDNESTVEGRDEPFTSADMLLFGHLLKVCGAVVWRLHEVWACTNKLKGKDMPLEHMLTGYRGT
eukprot:GHVQ01032805.1.p1 GENE.GHVQ01032805.1~~GHVQ01032805.1.p1  ORF type:complete len:904 (+),score=164.67 GHVQ01032805.1:284-2995(+)